MELKSTAVSLSLAWRSGHTNFAYSRQSGHHDAPTQSTLTRVFVAAARDNRSTIAGFIDLFEFKLQLAGGGKIWSRSPWNVKLHKNRGVCYNSLLVVLVVVVVGRVWVVVLWLWFNCGLWYYSQATCSTQQHTSKKLMCSVYSNFSCLVSPWSHVTCSFWKRGGEFELLGLL